MRTMRLKSRVSAPMCENRDRAECGKPSATKQLRRTKPVATCAVSLARLEQDSTHCLGELWLGELCICKIVCCAASPSDWFRLMLSGLHGIRHTPDQGCGIPFIELLTPSSTRIILKIPNAAGSDEVNGVRCNLCYVLRVMFSVATG